MKRKLFATGGNGPRTNTSPKPDDDVTDPGVPGTQAPAPEPAPAPAPAPAAPQ